MRSRPKLCKILFILKKRHLYGPYSHPHPGFSSGLLNSAKFSADMLAANGFTVKLVEVTDNNDIDREVTGFNPKIVIIEALWVVPSKFTVLAKLHPNVLWVVRIHSEAAFLAQEGIAIDWISQYPSFPNVYVAVNSLEAFHEVMTFWAAKGSRTSQLRYLPTFYPAPKKPFYVKKFSGVTINIACMGAIRVLKNTLIQAMAAIRFVDTHGWKLRFHVNVTRLDDGNSPYRNVVALFQNTRHELVQHDWMTHEDFITFMGGIDLGLQVSLSETFSIVTADMVSSGVPTVGSAAVRWLEKQSQADTISIDDIVNRMERAIKGNGLIKKNLDNLRDDTEHSEHEWVSTIKSLCESD